MKTKTIFIIALVSFFLACIFMSLVAYVGLTEEKHMLGLYKVLRTIFLVSYLTFGIIWLYRVVTKLIKR